MQVTFVDRRIVTRRAWIAYRYRHVWAGLAGAVTSSITTYVYKSLGAGLYLGFLVWGAVWEALELLSWKR